MTDAEWYLYLYVDLYLFSLPHPKCILIDKWYPRKLVDRGHHPKSICYFDISSLAMSKVEYVL